MGTPAYMAPEQARGEAVDERADVYALGAILYCALAGRAPFKGNSSDEVLDAVMNRPPVALEELMPGVPPICRPSCARRWRATRRCAIRPRRELAAELRRFQTGQLVAAHRYTRGALLLRWLRRHRPVVATGALALIVVAVMATLGVRRIVAERDRADGARKVAEIARHDADLARTAAVVRADDLTIGQARAALGRDPLTALAWLGTLPPSSPEATWQAAHEIAADAVRRGVARVLRGHEDDINELCYSPDGRWLASGSDDGMVRLWDSHGDGRVLRGHASALEVVRFSADSSQLASGAIDQKAIVWSTAGGEPRVLAGHTGTVRTLVFAPDGKTLVTGGEDSTVRLWPPSGEPVVLRVGAPVRVVLWLPDGRLAVALEDGRVNVLDSRGHWAWPAPARHTGTVRVLIASARGDRLFPAARTTTSASGRRHRRIAPAGRPRRRHPGHRAFARPDHPGVGLERPHGVFGTWPPARRASCAAMTRPCARWTSPTTASMWPRRAATVPSGCGTRSPAPAARCAAIKLRSRWSPSRPTTRRWRRPAMTTPCALDLGDPGAAPRRAGRAAGLDRRAEQRAYRGGDGAVRASAAAPDRDRRRGAGL